MVGVKIKEKTFAKRREGRFVKVKGYFCAASTGSSIIVMMKEIMKTIVIACRIRTLTGIRITLVSTLFGVSGESSRRPQAVIVRFKNGSSVNTNHLKTPVYMGKMNAQQTMV